LHNNHHYRELFEAEWCWGSILFSSTVLAAWSKRQRKGCCFSCLWLCV